MSQRTFFDDDAPENVPEWEEDDRSECWRARVAFADGAPGIFDYKIPDRLVGRLAVGCRVLVPLGKANRSVEAWCVEIVYGKMPIPGPNQKPVRLKEITSQLDPTPLLSKKMLALALWLSDRYLAPVGQTLDAILPAGVRSRSGTRLTTVWQTAPDAAEKCALLEERAKAAGDKEPITPKQKSVLAILAKSPEPMTLGELSRAAKCSLVPINALKKLGLMRSAQVRRESSIFADARVPVPRKEPLVLNDEQRRALHRVVEVLHTGESRTFLLHGVTGSGKTEVYIQAISEAVALGRQAIVLVPEISLTPQTVRRFRERFDTIAVLHSHLTDPERHVEWSRIASGEVQVVVGARSAIFAPLPRLGLIVIDEEHENSFKQETAPRYHAREVAIFRSIQEKIPLILGSATPSLESWYRMTTGEFERLALPNRVKHLPMPRVDLIDLRVRDDNRYGGSAIHRQLHRSIAEAIDKGGQVILFLNRRGFSTQIQCPVCGETLKCPNCDVSLTHHRTENIALCHYCDYQIPVPTECPNPKCGARNIRFSGFGTQRLESELAARFPNVPLLRMDTDTMQGRGAHERALSAFRAGEYKILLGTQMIAKGLDFPNVTLVGVISADTALYHPDFRASERTFHLITQVAGRTGRGEKGGHVLVQTYSPEHPAIQAAAHHDYAQFVAGELPARRRFGYPPYTAMVRLVVRGPDEAETAEFAQRLASALTEALEKRRETSGTDDAGKPLFRFRLLGPSPAPFAKLRGHFRFHLHLHANNGEALRAVVREIMTQKIKKPGEVQWIVDVDPLDML